MKPGNQVNGAKNGNPVQPSILLHCFLDFDLPGNIKTELFQCCPKIDQKHSPCHYQICHLKCTLTVLHVLSLLFLTNFYRVLVQHCDTEKHGCFKDASRVLQRLANEQYLDITNIANTAVRKCKPRSYSSVMALPDVAHPVTNIFL